jgi:hypothetical protein
MQSTPSSPQVITAIGTTIWALPPYLATCLTFLSTTFFLIFTPLMLGIDQATGFADKIHLRE